MRKSFLILPTAAALILGGFVALAPTANAAPTLVGTVEGESMTSMQGYGAVVKNDAGAVGGKYLFVDSNITVTKTFTTTAAADYFMFRTRTDPGVTPAIAKVRLDGVLIATQSIPGSSWGSYTYNVPVTQ